MATPIIKWAGGKTRLLPELIARMPPAFGRYYEPFAGGAALFFRLAPERAVLNDMNADLVTLYETVRDHVDALIGLLQLYQRDHGDSQFYGTRTLFNEHELTPLQRAAAFIYLNKTCFNGLWRVNSSGSFNVPMGDYKNPKIVDEQALRAASRALQGVTLRQGDYKAALVDVQPGDLVYFDPPYDQTFNGYTKEGTFDQHELAAVVRHLASHGVQVMLSNSATPLVREFYAPFLTDIVKCGRAINANGAKRGAVDEVIVCAGYSPVSQESAVRADAGASHRGLE